MPWRTENRACRPKGPNLPRPRRTERPCGATGEAAGEKWSIFRWSRRTRRTTKGHEDCQCILEITVQAQRAKPSTAKDTKDQGALKRPGEQSVQAQSAKPSTATENRTRDKRATGEALCKDQASKPLNFQTSTKGARPARRPVGAWRASHAMLWFWKSIGISRRPIGLTVAYAGRAVALNSSFVLLLILLLYYCQNNPPSILQGGAGPRKGPLHFIPRTNSAMLGTKPIRTYVYIDGFNLYYGLLRGQPAARWLDLEAFVKGFLPERYEVARIIISPPNLKPILQVLKRRDVKVFI